MADQRGAWRILSKELKYETPWIAVHEHKVISPGGRDTIYGTVHMKAHSFGVIPLDDDGRTVLVGQHRFPLDTYSWEIVEGGGQAAFPEQSARRELKEETGLEALHLFEILKADISNSITDEQASVYVAWGLRNGAAAPDDTEDLALRWLPFCDLLKLALEGHITDVLSLTAIFKLKLLFDAQRLPEPLMSRVEKGMRKELGKVSPL